MGLLLSPSRGPNGPDGSAHADTPHGATRGVRGIARRILGSSALFRNSITLISGTVATQAIVFAFSPILSRVFVSADFGYLANYNAWVAVLVLLSNFRYELAIIVAKGRERTNRVMVLTGLLSLTSVALYASIAVAIWYFYSGGGYLASLRPIVLLIPLGVLVNSFSSLFIQYNVKAGHFRLLATVAAVQVVATVVPQIALGLMRVPNGLILGNIVGFVFSGIVFARAFFRGHSFDELRREITPRRLRATAAAHVNFPRFMLGADAIGVGVQQFVPVFVLALFSPAIAGLYAFSVRVVRVPMIVISTAVAGALRKEAVDHVHGGKRLLGLFVGTVRSLSLMSLVPFVVLLLFGRELFGFVFGHQWIEAGHIVQILSPGILVEFVAFPLSAFFLVTNTQRYSFVVQIVGFVLMVAALWYGKHLVHDFVTTCYLLSGVMVVVNLMTIAFAAKVSGVRRPGALVRVT